MERQQNIRQASVRHIAKNFTLRGEEIEQNSSGGMVVLGRGICPSCGNVSSVDCCL